MPDAQFVFLAPPRWDELVRRLVGRGTEDAEEQQRRLETAQRRTGRRGGVRPRRRQRRRPPGSATSWFTDGADRRTRAGSRTAVTPASTYRRDPCPEPRCPQGIINPPIDELLEAADSKYALVIFAAKRARQINAYYAQLHEGLFEYVGPLVDTKSNEKPLSIALREINEGKLTSSRSRLQSPATTPADASPDAHRPRRRGRHRRLQGGRCCCACC